MHSFLDISSQIYKKDTKKLPLPGVLCGIITDYLTFIQDYIKVVEFVEWLDLVRFPVP